MLKKLRRNLTVTFVFTSLLMYTIILPVALAVFAHGLNGSVDNSLTRLLAEIQPSITFVANQPTLEGWAKRANEQHVVLLNTVQLYDQNKNLLQAYGRAGVIQLIQGGLRADPRGRHRSIRSKYLALHPSGYLQVQVETQAIDDAITQFVITMLLILPILAGAAAGCGWFFAANAVRPVARSMYVLRRFVADAAHELKTPTTIIQAATQTLQAKSNNNKEVSDLIDVLTRASHRLRKLGDDLVLLARMESPELKLAMQVLSLDQLVSEIAEDFSELAKNKSIKLSVGELPRGKVNGNADSLSRVLINLVDNAIRYTEPGGTVQLSIEQQEQSWLLIVEDTGIGMPPHSLKHIFDR